MTRETRDKFASGTDQSNLTGGNACWETPFEVFTKLNQDFGPFEIDLFANGINHLCARWYGPDSSIDAEDALAANWTDHCLHGYGNPPYGPFVQKALAKAKLEAGKGFHSTLLLPMRVTKAFKAHVLDGASDLLFCDKRLVFFENGLPRISFDKQGRPRPDSAMFDSIIVRYTPGHVGGPNVGLWNVPVHVSAVEIEAAVERLRGRAA